LLRGRYPTSSLIPAHPTPSRLRPPPGFRPVARPTCLRRFLAGARRASPVDSTRPRHRAAATTPPEGTIEAGGGWSLLPSPSGDRLGFRICPSRGYPCVHLRCGPVTRSPPQRWLRRRASVHSVSLLAAVQATGFPACTQVGLAPTERASLHWSYHQTRRWNRGGSTTLRASSMCAGQVSQRFDGRWAFPTDKRSPAAVDARSTIRRQW